MFETNEYMYFAAGFGLTALLGTLRVARARRQRWADNQSWRELMVRVERERSGLPG